MTKIIDFYLGEANMPETDLTIQSIWNMSDEKLEYGHSWVQWAFPLTEPSNFNPDAPLLTEEDILLFKENPILQSNLLTSFIRFINFLGISLENEKLIQNDNFQPILWTQPNHNWFRITRVLNSLKLLGLERQAEIFYIFLSDLHFKKGYVSKNSFTYWARALLYG